MKRLTCYLTVSTMMVLALCCMMNCSNNSQKAPANNAEGASAVTTSDGETAEAPEETVDTTATQQPADSSTAEANPPTRENVEIKPIDVDAAIGRLATRTVSDNKLTTMLETIARNLEDKKLEYVSSLGQDCSGIFHQLKDSIQMRMPTLADQSKYMFPSFRDQRNSRQIADWYYRNNNLLIVQDPMAVRNKIRPGSVMFFGRTDEKYEDLNIDLLTNPGKFVHDGVLGKIMHIAVVTSVEKDDEGNVTGYTMMHGRNKRYPASRSSGNYDGPGGYKTQFVKFPFGNWNQQWVAMAHIETPK